MSSRAPRPLLRISTYTPLAAKVESAALLSHKVSLVQSPGDKRVFVRKEMPDPKIARMEVLAQEFFRLIVPHQPETQLAIDPKTGVHYILSQQILGYHPLPEGKADNFANGTYTGLGQATLISMFLQETDLKNGNIGLDDGGRVIKIDGDWCFSAGRRNEGPNLYKLTPRAIEHLPYPKDCYSYNWLDLVKEGVNYEKSPLITPELSHAPQFRSEVNQALLKICLMPDSLIEKLVDAHMPAGGEPFVKLLKDRRDQLRLSAAKVPSYQEYMLTPEAKEATDSLIEQMKSFKANGVPLVSVDEQASLAREIKAQAAAFTLGSECRRLLDDIEACNLSVLNEYVARNRARIANNIDNPAGLLAIKTELSLGPKCFQLLYEIKELRLVDNDLTFNAYFSRNEVRITRNLANPTVLLAIKAELSIGPECYRLLDEIKAFRSGVDDPGLNAYILRSRERIGRRLANPAELLAIKAELSVASECHRLLDDIQAHRLSKDDTLVNDYVSRNRERINKSLANPAELLTIKTELLAISDSVSSHEVEEVKIAISTLREEANSWFTSGKGAKADGIQAAFFRIPLHERGTVLTHEGPPNAVQEAMSPGAPTAKYKERLAEAAGRPAPGAKPADPAASNKSGDDDGDATTTVVHH